MGCSGDGLSLGAYDNAPPFHWGTYPKWGHDLDSLTYTSILTLRWMDEVLQNAISLLSSWNGST